VHDFRRSAEEGYRASPPQLQLVAFTAEDDYEKTQVHECS